MKKGLQTHFNLPIGVDLLREVRSLGWETARIDGMEGHSIEPMISETVEAGLEPFVIVDSIEELARVPAGLDAEWTNELDGDVTPSFYRRTLDRAAGVAASLGIRLWAPCISNLDFDSLWWMRLVRGSGWPKGLHGISAHSYGPFPHDGFRSREDEVRQFKQLIDGKPYRITECGLASTEGVSEEEQADFLIREFEFWTAQGAEAAYWFQLNDGPTDHPEHRFGIRRFDGSWKPNAGVFAPEVEEEMANEAEFFISRSKMIDQGDGTYTYPWNGGVLSIQPDGRKETRPVGTNGAWERFTIYKDSAVFSPEGNYYGFYMVP